ncbi:hypothetical protein FHW69_001621 [Luteibacter sp. Sphag1AF]|uniref:hypothetical protein n=1 Tax=Luteibacter sp. Sphag1AF TaxID=2587031 RepID=UPI00160CEA46|nr:hypothetical protein [Luteibacter sp. Sphag1AF]MBB3227020.1 hypothetical protein [Luteibacter sp. Sphag1AF]
MLILTVITLVLLGMLLVQEMRARYWIAETQILQERLADSEEKYLGMASENIDLRIRLDDSKQAYSNLIRSGAEQWAYSTAGRVH